MKRVVIVTALSILAALYFIYFYFTRDQIDAGTLGTLGDFIGGNINPVLTLISTILLIETLNLQRKATTAAEESADETKKTVERQGLLIRTQIFESSFFNLVNLCLDEYKGQEIDVPKGHLTGSRVFNFIEQEFTRRKKLGEEPSEIIEEIDSDFGDIIFNTIKSFSSIFGFVLENAPEENKDRYISLATKLTPVPVIYLICIARLHTDWALLKPIETSGFFNKKGIQDLMDGFR
ncbi:TPA: hypothetical protein ACGJ2Y_000034 [Pseudomonas aeruginosa]|uniref:hypothetical protein n=1 Tax=Pseudomonas TaxID=286 RepID=UPI0003B9F91B|nr:hypothetical protein [Pseudomonas aeruginosa]ELD4444440.1 hypothetical protein [Pseudomonas aeruginosa]ERU90324.1 hypothetical protein Q084_03460 [Pseudomonas aeruginosa M9A.1]MCS8546354.1 hypothetical protein [Pseudomonas aeruginosa]MCT1235869.1 hypothetical protein [Pseudomonas aeruginosa]MDA3425070.1 hypothetical protein [Pseudomonas aeruginosa]